MAFQAVPQTVGLNIRGTFQGVDVENTFYYKYVGTMTEEILADLVSAALTAWSDNWKPLLSTGYTLREIYARDLSTEAAVQFGSGLDTGNSGTLTGDTLPNYATIAVARRSGLTGRSTRGRIFWPGIVESQAANNSLAAGVAEDIVAAIESIDLAAIALDLVPVIVSRYTAGAPRLVALTYELLTWLVVDQLLDTRRSRKPGVGS